MIGFYLIIELEKQLVRKEHTMDQLSQFIDLKDCSDQQVLAISHDEDERDDFRAAKMSKTDQIMAQVNLDVIESHGS